MLEVHIKIENAVVLIDSVPTRIWNLWPIEWSLSLLSRICSRFSIQTQTTVYILNDAIRYVCICLDQRHLNSRTYLVGSKLEQISPKSVVNHDRSAKVLLRKLITKYLLPRLEQCTLLVSRNTSQILRHMRMWKHRLSIMNYWQYTGTPRSR